MSDLEAVDRLFVWLGSLHRRHGSATLHAALAAAREAISDVEDAVLREGGMGGLPRSGSVVPFPTPRRPAAKRSRKSVRASTAKSADREGDGRGRKR